jgi:hypothetical protein
MATSFTGSICLQQSHSPSLEINLLRHHRLLVNPATGTILTGPSSSRRSPHMEVLNVAWSSSPSPVGAATIKVPLAQSSAAALKVVTCGPPSVIQQLIDKFQRW